MPQSPCLKKDQAGNPHVSWFEETNGNHLFSYRFWDGIAWAYRRSPIIDKSYDIVASIYSMIIENHLPVLAHVVKYEDQSCYMIKSVPSGSSWEITEYNLPGDVQWYALLPNSSDYGISSSSYSMSSSSSSGGVTNDTRTVATYDGNSMRIYEENGSLVLLGQIDVNISDIHSIRIGVNFGYTCIAFNRGDAIYYNFFNQESQTWQWANFRQLSMSYNVNGISYFDAVPVLDGVNLSLAFCWIEKSPYRIQQALASLTGVESFYGLSSTVHTGNDSITVSETYVSGAYDKISLSYEDTAPVITGSGAKFSKFQLYGSDWIESHIIAPVNGVEYISTYTDDVLNILLVSGRDVYYFEESLTESSEVAYPDMIILNDEKTKTGKWKRNNAIDSSDISGCGAYDSKTGSILPDGRRNVMVALTEEDPYCFSSSTSSESSHSSESSESSVSEGSVSSLDSSETDGEICNVLLQTKGGDEGYIKDFDVSTQGEMVVHVERFVTYHVKDQLIIKVDGVIAFDSGCVRTNNVGIVTGDIFVPADSLTVTVQVVPNCEGTTGTLWTLKLTCTRYSSSSLSSSSLSSSSSTSSSSSSYGYSSESSSSSEQPAPCSCPSGLKSSYDVTYYFEDLSGFYGGFSGYITQTLTFASACRWIRSSGTPFGLPLTLGLNTTGDCYWYVQCADPIDRVDPHKIYGLIPVGNFNSGGYITQSPSYGRMSDISVSE